mmetsp:Transcript_24498/g.34190  ORF Transcript_24498/g.34190 Transcript_24498/m.34190 type:complete len:82 (+) Transcript_24498:1016-1261(+)
MTFSSDQSVLLKRFYVTSFAGELVFSSAGLKPFLSHRRQSTTKLHIKSLSFQLLLTNMSEKLDLVDVSRGYITVCLCEDCP